MEVFDFVVEWLSYGKKKDADGNRREAIEDRQQYADKLMQHIRFPLISNNDLQKIEENGELMRLPSMCSLLLEAWKKRAGSTHTVSREPSERLRKRKTDVASGAFSSSPTFVRQRDIYGFQRFN